MPYNEIIAAFSEIHTNHINTHRGQKEQRLNIKAGGIHTYHCI